MSHFSVIVIGDDFEAQLQPYHEYECTGIEDQYVVDVNYDEEVKEFLNREMFVGKDEKGEYQYEYNAENAKKLTDVKEMTRLEYFKLLGYDDEKIDEEIVEYHGVTKKDGSWFRKTNPNAKWDWYQVGGRWSGFLKMKKGAEGLLGRPGVFGNEPEEGGADIIRKGEVDWEGMREKAGKEAKKKWKLVNKEIKDIPEHETWESIRERMTNIDEARTFYHNQERIKAFKQVREKNPKYFGYFDDFEDYLCSEEEYVEREMNSSITTYAVVKDSVWYQKGEMGWWGMSSNEMSQDEWNKKCWELIQSVPDDELLTLVDCHI